MKPTREQLELAAKAAGIDVRAINQDSIFTEDENHQLKRWKPTTSKSDSFDIMVACGIEPMFHDCAVSALSGSDFRTEPIYWLDQDKGLATVWAIFLCAVEIGRGL